MKTLICSMLVILGLSLNAQAQDAVSASTDHQQLLHSTDTQLAKNKRLVYDFYREVLEAGQLDRAQHYLSETYIQHNPNLASGRLAFTEFFKNLIKPQPPRAKIRAPLVAITAESDLVVLSFVQTLKDPKDPTKKYTTTWFDMFRIENNQIVQHWDSALRE